MARLPFWAASGEALRMEGEAEVPDWRPSLEEGFSDLGLGMGLRGLDGEEEGKEEGGNVVGMR